MCAARIVDVRLVGHLLKQTGLVEVESDEGCVGIGATSGPTAVIAALIDDLRDLVVGADPAAPADLWQRMFDGYQARRGRGGEGGVAVNAMAAIDMAVWDLAGKLQQKPVHQLLTSGGPVQDRIVVYASATAFARETARGGRGWKSELQLVEESLQYVDEGFRAIKFGWGNHFGEEELRQIGAIREAIGPDVLLMLDFGCPAYNDDSWTEERAIDLTRRLEPLDLFFLEEALRPYDVWGFEQLTRASNVPIATGESLVTPTDFEHFIHRRAADVLQPDAQQMGITQLCRVAQRAEEDGVLCVPHCPWTAMAVAAHVNVLSTLINSVMIEYPAFASYGPGTQHHATTCMMHERIVEQPLVFRDGFIELPTSPGLGVGGYVPEAVVELESS